MKPFPPEVVRGILHHGAGLTVLVVRLGALGDILRTLPAVRLIRFSLPEARMVWICDDRWISVLEDHPDLDGVISFPRSRIRRGFRSPSGWPSLPGAVTGLRRTLRAHRPGLALDFHGNLRSGVVAWLSGAGVRLGHAGPQQREGNRLFNTHRVQARPHRTSRIDRNLDLVRALGLPDGPVPDAGLSISAEAAQASGEIVRGVVGSAPYALISPSASRRQGYKKPPATLLAAAARALGERGIRSVAIYGPGEDDDARALVAESGEAARLAPPTDLPTLAALLRRARLFVGGDTGPLHMACAVGCPVVGIYGPTDPVVNAPWGSIHAVVHPPGRVYTGVKRRDREAGGFEGIDADMVTDAVLSVLDRSHAQRATHDDRVTDTGH